MCESDASPYKPPKPASMKMICQFNELKPLKFKGGSDTLAYVEWLRKLENLCKIMECLERFKVHLATYQFKKEVEFWY